MVSSTVAGTDVSGSCTLVIVDRYACLVPVP